MSRSIKVKNPIVLAVTGWFGRTFADPEAISLFMVLLIGLLLLKFLGSLLMPVLFSIVLAYLLNTVVKVLMLWRVPRLVAVYLVFIVFIGLLIYAFLYLIPLLWRQLSNLVAEMPNGFNNAQLWLAHFMTHHPKVLSDIQLEHVVVFVKEQSPKAGQMVLQFTLRAIPNLAELILYVILVPLLVFFFLKDNQVIINWSKHYLPRRRTLVKKVWLEVHNKIGVYVKGRVIEVFIVGIISVIAFALLKLQYAVLLGALVGLSVIIPYVGAVVVTIPVVIVALMEWGLSTHFWSLIIVYVLIIALDANILFPLLFAETMALHPIVIILSVLIFGGIWGFWGVFFAIPLATLVNAVLKAWPRYTPENEANE